MKKHFIVFLIFLSGCSFKKNPQNHATSAQSMVSKAELFAEQLKTADENVVLTAIKSATLEDLKKFDSQVGLLKSALVRGSFNIVQALLYAQISPYNERSTYRGDSTFDKNAFIAVSAFNAKIAMEIISLASFNNIEKLQDFMTDHSLACSTVIDLIQEYKISHPEIRFNDVALVSQFKKMPSCTNLNLTDLKHEWLSKELFTLYYHPDRLSNPDFFIFLASLFTRYEFNFDPKVVIPNQGFSPQALLMFKINQVTPSDQQQPFDKIWLKTINNISNPTFQSPILTYFDGAFYLKGAKIESAEEINQYFNLSILRFIEPSFIMSRDKCFVSCMIP